MEVYFRSPFNPDNDWLEFLGALGGQVAVAIDSASLFEQLQRSNNDMLQAYDATIEGWSRALDLRDKETEGHTQRVTRMTIELARAFGMPEEQLVHVRRGALLHDIGKLGVPDAILLKPGPLTDEEWVLMKQHPSLAYGMLSPIDYLRPATRHSLVPSREMGRFGLSARPGGRGHPAGSTHLLGCRCLGCPHVRSSVSPPLDHGARHRAHTHAVRRRF